MRTTITLPMAEQQQSAMIFPYDADDGDVGDPLRQVRPAPLAPLMEQVTTDTCAGDADLRPAPCPSPPPIHFRSQIADEREP